jgi:Tol biopolymer transport system component
MSADGTNGSQLTANTKNNFWPSVTPDGRFIVFQSDRTGAMHLWRMNIDGSNQKQLTFGTLERYPDCSPDSKWVVYNSWESGKATVWKISIEGGTPEQITDVACFSPVVSRNGNLIACDSGKSSPSQRLIIPSAGGKPVKMLDVPPGARGFPLWTSDGKALTYLVDTREGVTNIWSQTIDGSPPKQLTNFKPDQKAASSGMGPYAWSQDGKQLAFARDPGNLSDVVLIRDLR